jgi:spore coat polysaccharide biosynthesis protein SpsF
LSIVAVIQARMGSTRLPGKVLLDVSGEPLLFHVVARAEAMRQVDAVVVATSSLARDDAIEGLCQDRGWACFRGDEEDVLDRYYRAAQWATAEHVVRVTSDCPLVCVEEADRVIERHLEARSDYAHNITVWGGQTPLGTGVEIFTFDALEVSWREGQEPHHREHVDEYVGEHPERFHIEVVVASPALRRPELRLTVDTPDDLELVREIYRRLYHPGQVIPLAEVVSLLDANPRLTELNRHVVQKPI